MTDGLISRRANPVRRSNHSSEKWLWFRSRGDCVGADFLELREFFSRFNAVRFLQRFFHFGSSFFYGSTKTMLR